MGTQQIINVIDSVQFNKILEPLNSISVQLSRLPESLKEIVNLSINSRGFFDRYGAALFGLVGTLIGTIFGVGLAYLFNRQLQKNESIRRCNIQVKNLIYAPIYKELLKLNEYVRKVNESGICILQIVVDKEKDNSYRESGYFTIWNEIQKDIRELHVAIEIKDLLDKIDKNWNEYKKYKETIDKNFKDQYNSSLIETLYQEAQDKERGSHVKVRMSLNVPKFLFKKDSEFKQELNDIIEHDTLNKEEYSNLVIELERLFTEISKMDRRDFFHSYDSLLKSIDEAMIIVRYSIETIMKKYEYM